MPVNAFLGEAPQVRVDPADPATSANAADDDDDNDSDGPSLPSRRGQRRLSARSSHGLARASALSTTQSGLKSTQLESTSVLHPRKRLHKRTGTRHDSPTPDHDDSLAGFQRRKIASPAPRRRCGRPRGSKTRATTASALHSSPAIFPSPEHQDQPTWAVDRIVSIVRKNGKVFYEVKWENTLEPAKSLRGCADRAVAEFFAMNPGASP